MAKRQPPLMAGNWKMNLNHLEAIALVQKLAFTLTPDDYEAVEVVVLPPYTDLRSVQTLVDGDKLLIRYGAQDLSAHEKGAYTGDISGAMLAKLGCSYVVVGHSERRQYHAETDELVAAKLRSAYAAGITPILCVGEPLEVRKAGTHVGHVIAQLDGALAGIDAERVKTLVVAYEPVWAIGTGEVATPGRRARGLRGDPRSAEGGVRRRPGDRGAGALRRLGQGRQHRRDHGRSATSTAPWSVAPASMPRVRRDRALPAAPAAGVTGAPPLCDLTVTLCRSGEAMEPAR